MKKIFCALFITALTLTSAIAGTQTGTVIQMIVQDATTSVNSGQLFVTISGTYNSQPTCNANGGWTIRADTPGGKAMIASVIAAQLAGKSITIVGTGVCTIWGDREDVSYILVQS